MEFTEAAELEDKVSLVRSERLLEVATEELSQTQNEKRRSQRLHLRASIFGNDLTVVRLFSTSPSEETFLIDKGDVDRYGKEPALVRRNVAFNHVKSNADANVKENKGGQGVNDDNKKKTMEPVQFKLEPVGLEFSTGRKKSGGLTKTFESRETNSPRMSDGMQQTGRQIRLIIYIPKKQFQVKLNVPYDATVYMVVKAVLKFDKLKNKPNRLYQDPGKYEIRIHEEDGLPDPDYPSLDDDVLISDFCETDPAEFCLCNKGSGSDSDDDDSDEEFEMAEGGEDEEGFEGGSDTRVDVPQSVEHAATPSAATPAVLPPANEIDVTEYASKTREEKYIRVYIPENGSYVTTKVTMNMRALDLLVLIQKKQRLPIFTEEYQLLVNEEDRVRLKMISREIDMKQDLYKSDYKNLELVRKEYADRPFGGNNKNVSNNEADQQGRDRGNSAAIHHDEPPNIQHHTMLRYDPDNFLFNDQTAALYEEFDVVKINKQGRRQRRVFGINYQKIYNRKQQRDIKGGGKILNINVKRAERLIADIIKFNLDKNDPRIVEILWKDQGPLSAAASSVGVGTSAAPLRYEFEDGEKAARVVAKLSYIRANRGDA